MRYRLLNPCTLPSNSARSITATSNAINGEDGITINVEAKNAPYHKELRAEKFQEDSNAGLRLYEPDGKIRLIALGAGSNKVSFQATPVNNVYGLNIELVGKVGE
jgi:hypothetical protein